VTVRSDREHYDKYCGLDRLRRKQEDKAGRARPDACEVCGGANKDSARKLHFDHDHATGEFRGWLCQGCNHALGQTGDSPATLRKLADYLEKPFGPGATK
jgi:hypothetical protein